VEGGTLPGGQPHAHCVEEVPEHVQLFLGCRRLKRMMSSAKASTATFSPAMLIPAEPPLMRSIMGSSIELKSRGESGSPCLTSRLSWILTRSLLAVVMVVQQSSYIRSIKFATRSGRPLHRRQGRRAACGTVSKALAMSTTVTTPPESAFMWDKAFRSRLMLALQPSWAVNPAYLLANRMCRRSLPSITPVNRRASIDPMVIGLQLRTSATFFPGFGMSVVLFSRHIREVASQEGRSHYLG